MGETKINILSPKMHMKVVSFINAYDGLPIDCELELENKFPEIESHTLKSILFTEWNQKVKANYASYLGNAPGWLQRFESESESSYDPSILLRISKEFSVSPTILCRLVIGEKYKDLQKFQLSDMLKAPHTIPDIKLGANIRMCVMNDNQEGPIVDLRRRCLGEEYEVKLKEKATEAKLSYFDEADLRRTGFDKTPDMKLVLPCLYRGAVVNWIESKALFGDIKTHRRYLNQQLVSYENRFGPGIVIYWFGYEESILDMKENGDGLIILNDFPAREDLEIFK